MAKDLIFLTIYMPCQADMLYEHMTNRKLKGSFLLYKLLHQVRGANFN